MGKKIDLNSKPNNEFNQKKHNNRLSSLSLPSKENEENRDEELSKKEQMQKQAEEVVKETAKAVAKEYLAAHGVPKFIANSKIVDESLDKAIDKTVDKIKKAIKVAKIMSIIFTIFTICTILLPILIVIILIMLFLSYYENNNQTAGSGYYTPRCNEITVIFVDKNNDYAITNSATYSLDDYIAGVVYAYEEVRGANNIEVYKTFAIAARTFLEVNADNTCTIEGSSSKQKFEDINAHEDKEEYAAELIYQAIKETKNEVIMQNNELYDVMYDAFYVIEKDENYYTIKQKNQKIPVDWANSHVSSKYRELYAGDHGQGISQYGAYYLADTQGYNYKDIIEYYLGDDVTITSKSFMTSIAGLDVKETKNATNEINEKLSNFLEQRGSSIEQYEEFIKSNVIASGAGTREGVVTAAVSLINYLYDNFDAKLPYYWGGKYSKIGILNSFGEYSPSEVSRGGNVNYYKSFDCSGFVQWAIINGGFNNPGTGTATFNDKFSSNSCMERDSDCIGQPGDLINLSYGHVMLIVATDVESGKYMVAESTGDGVIMQLRTMHKIGKNYKVLFMDDYYQNNVNPNYVT